MTTLTPTRRGRCAGKGEWQAQYQALRMTPREAAELIRDGDVLAFAAMANWPWELDGALADRLLETGGRVAILGQTGRNFAAGMSGGIAYVWNPRGDFDYYCNMEMVELTLLDRADDREELHRLIITHVRHTNSAIGRRMLENWESYVRQFIKVTPVEYKRYLEQTQKQ